MSKIATYSLADSPLQLSDRLIGTEAPRPILSSTPLATKNFSLGELLQLFSSEFPAATLQAVLDAGNIATQDINLTGTIYVDLIKPTNIEDMLGSQGAPFQILSKAIGGFNWVDPPGSITLTTDGDSGPATLTGGVLNIPIYAAGNTPTLQQVTDAGNTITDGNSTTSLNQYGLNIVGDNENVFIGLDTGFILGYNGPYHNISLAFNGLSFGTPFNSENAGLVAGGLIAINASSDTTYSADFILKQDKSSTKTITINYPATITGVNKTVTFQDASGTIALTSDIPTITTPTLQQVTDEGNTTTNSISIVSGNPSDFTIVSLDSISTSNSVSTANISPSGIGINEAGFNIASAMGSGGFSFHNIALDNVTSLFMNSLEFIKNGVGKYLRIGDTSLGEAIYNLPNKDYNTGIPYVLATLDDIPSSTGGIPHATASGTDTYTATITGVTSYADGDAYLIRFTNGNTTGATLNINSLGAIQLYRNNDGPLIGGDVLSGAEMLCVYNSTSNIFQCIGTAPNSLYAYVTNDDSVTLTKGMAVYAFSGTGDRMTVKRAFNTSDATSAQTVGLVLSASIAPNQKGIIITQGLLDGLSILPTSTWTDGDAVYLGATAGTITNVKPFAPNHLVYLGTVTTASNGSAGRLYVRVQNGYELQELHNVQAQSPSLKDTLWYDNTVSPAQWKTASISTILGYTPGTVSSVAALTLGTSGTDLSSSVATGTTTPVITLNVPTASATNRGVLSSADWTTFNNKQNTATLIADSVDKAILRNNYFWFLPNTITTGQAASFAASERINGSSFVLSGNGNITRSMTAFNTSTTPGNISFMRQNNALQLQGYEVVFTRKIQFNSNVSGQRFFCGISKGNQFAAPTNVDQTTLTDIVGVAQLSTSTNMHVIHNDASGTATTIDLGSSYPCNDSQYNYYITIEQTTTSYIVTVERVTISTGASISTVNTLSTNIPVYNTGTIQLLTWITNNAQSSVASYLDGGAIGYIKNV